jgi:hypothetical protein
MIIAAFAGTGKTTLANSHPDEFVDFVCMPYKYELTGDNESEAGKANPDNILRDDWPHNYVGAIIAAMDVGKHLLIPSDSYVLALLQMKSIPYILCYPKREAKDEYRRRFAERGNTQEFLDIFIDRWDRFMDSFEQDTYGNHLILEPTAYLSDVFGDE